MNFIIWVILGTLYGVIAETILLLVAGIPLNDGSVIFMLIFQLAAFPALVFHCERKTAVIPAGRLI
ncbi:MAG TPA: hypothetical protein PLR75_03100 [Candidatus Pacearchaeota archaeon]|nr:hypothetical protein [Candidatus Pacearchaeota archaeon]